MGFSDGNLLYPHRCSEGDAVAKEIRVQELVLITVEAAGCQGEDQQMKWEWASNYEECQQMKWKSVIK